MARGITANPLIVTFQFIVHPAEDIVSGYLICILMSISNQLYGKAQVVSLE